MFLCSTCHDADKCLATLSPYRSYGVCEACKKSKECVDCHSIACQITYSDGKWQKKGE